MTRITRLSVLTLALAALTACTLPLSAEAHDEWKRTYQLAPGGTFEIRNTNGQIKVEPGDGNTVEVVATRTARAGSQEDANNALKQIEIRETVSPDHIVLDSSHGLSFGLHINTSHTVEYRVRLPKGSKIDLKNTNGDLVVSGMAGAARFETTNGEIHATELEGSVRAETTNGDVTIELAKLVDDGVDCSTTNGGIDLTLPRGSKASIDVETNNGSIDTGSIELAIKEKDRRNLRATMDGGGAKVKLETTNGDIRIRRK